MDTKAGEEGREQVEEQRIAGGNRSSPAGVKARPASLRVKSEMSSSIRSASATISSPAVVGA